MRQPRAKIHLIDVAEPLLCFCHLKMRCGIEIVNAEPVFMMAEDEGLLFTFPIRTCIACLRLPPRGEDKRRYAYGLMEAESALHLKAEAS